MCGRKSISGAFYYVVNVKCSRSFLLQAEDGPRSCEAPAFELTMSAETTRV